MRKGWTETTLGEVAKITSGFAFSTRDWSDDGIPVIKINNVRNGKVSLEQCSFVKEPLPRGAEKFILRKGDLLITLTGEIGAIGFVDQEIDLLLNQRVGKIETIGNLTSKAFIGLFLDLDSTRKEMWSHGKGNAQLNISPKSIEGLALALPPIPVQKRIVDLIASVDSYIEALEQQVGSARKSRSAILHKMLSAGGDGWTETTLGEVTEIQMGQSPDGSTYNSEGVGLPFMQGSAEFGEHYPKPEKWCSEPKKIAETGDLLLSVRAPVGDTNFADQRIAVGRGLSVIRAKSFLSDIMFIRMFIQSNINEMISNSGSGMFSSITGQNLRNFTVFLPPLPEQKRIVDLISSMDDEISATEKLIKETKQLRSGLLSDLLSGNHEIPESYDKVIGAE